MSLCNKNIACGCLDCISLQKPSAVDKVDQWTIRNKISSILLCQIFWSYANGLTSDDDLQDLPVNFACPCCGFTLLHLAVAFGSVTYLEHYLNSQINVNAINDNGDTALHMAVASEDATMVNLLLSHNADPHIPDDLGATPLQVFFAMQSKSQTIADALLRHGGGISQFFQGTGAVEQLLQANRHIDDGMTPLCKATRDNDLEKVRRLLEIGACPNLRYSYGTPLMSASYSGLEEIVGLLLDAGANMCHVQSNGQSALNYAVLGGHHHIVMAFLDRRFNPNLKDVFQHTALDIAILKNDTKIVESLLDHDAHFLQGEDLHFQALEYGAVDALIALIKRDIVDINAPNKDGQYLYDLAEEYEERRFMDFIRDNCNTSH